jgi:hypothetical protein
MTMRPARRARTEVPLRTEWMFVPVRFWAGEWVGWRIRMAWVVRRMPALLRRGWAEKRMTGWMKTEAQTVAVSWDGV